MLMVASSTTDYSLAQEGDGVRINLDNQYSRIYKGSSHSPTTNP